MKKKGKPSILKYNLLQNANESLLHAVNHITDKNDNEADNLKRAILDLTHVVELLLKEKLKSVHPAFIWDNIDKYPNIEFNTINTEKAISRLMAVAGVNLDIRSIETIKECRKLRNQIEHFEFSIPTKRVKLILGRILSFIIVFAINHLNIDYIKQFNKDDSWKALLDIYEFWKVHGKHVEDELRKHKRIVCECPLCGATTFDIKKGTCELCFHDDEYEECENCHLEFWKSEGEHVVGLMDDKNIGVYCASSLCPDCFKQLSL